MLSGVHNEVLLAGGYTIFLAASAFVLEWLARRSHGRASQYENAGFVYRQRMDMWECPAGQQLVRIETDYQRRAARYQAPAEACNACSLKLNCTDSEEGRLLETRLNPWLDSELRRFHRGISLVLLLLATIILLSEMARHEAPHELLIAGGLLIPVGIAETKLFASFVRRQRET